MRFSAVSFAVRSLANVFILVSLLLPVACDSEGAKPAWHKEVSQVRSKVEKLGKEVHLAQWIEFADKLRDNVLTKLLLIDGAQGGRLIVRTGDHAYHASLEEPIKWEETLTSAEADSLTNKVQSLRKTFRDLGLVGFERNEDREIVSLYVEPNVVLVVLRNTAGTQAQQMFERFAEKGQDPRGDIVIKISPRVYGKSERR